MTLWDEKFGLEERNKERIMKVGEKRGRREGRKEDISTGIKLVANNLLKNMHQLI